MSNRSNRELNRGWLARWKRKFAVAFSGAWWAMRTQNSFYVHLTVAAIALALSGWLRMETWRWALLVICIAMVLAIELLNTAIESLVARLHPEQDPAIGRALDSAAAAVLIASLGAVIVGLIVIGPPLLEKLGILGGPG